MTRATLMGFVGGMVFWFAGMHVHAGPGDQVVTNAHESSPVVRSRPDQYRDPFVPKSGVPSPAGSSPEERDATGNAVKVMGTLSTAQGRWAMLEFEDGARRIVVPGQILSAYSRVVKRITEKGVTLSATGDTAGPQAERTYRLDEERD